MSSLRYVGLDVHRDSIAVAIAPEGNGVANVLGVVPNEPDAIRHLIRRLGRPAQLRCCYEAGPCGYVLYRQLTALGVGCQVVAPSLIPVRPGDRVKTDRRDALKLALGLRAGTLTAVWVPEPTDEALRDLMRAREDGHAALLRCRHQLSKFLLRAGVRPPAGMRAWTQRHRHWLEQLQLPQRAQQVALDEYGRAVDEGLARIDRLDRQLLELVGESRFAEVVTALQALHGVGFITAVTVSTEVIDFGRFRPRQLMGYTGLCPSEHSSGGRRRQGSISRAGNAHLRRVLVESAWHYRKPWRDSRRRRSQEAALPAWLRQLSHHAESRLHRRFTRIISRGKPPQKAAVAVARELVAFMWAVDRTLAEQRMAG